MTGDLGIQVLFSHLSTLDQSHFVLDERSRYDVKRRCSRLHLLNKSRISRTVLAVVLSLRRYLLVAPHSLIDLFVLHEAGLQKNAGISVPRRTGRFVRTHHLIARALFGVTRLVDVALSL